VNGLTRNSTRVLTIYEEGRPRLDRMNVKAAAWKREITFAFRRKEEKFPVDHFLAEKGDIFPNL